MREALTVSSRGQVTLPAELRKRLGIQAGGVVIAEECDGQIILRPAAILEVETYNDKDIAQWDREDRLTDEERRIILKKLEGTS